MYRYIGIFIGTGLGVGIGKLMHLQIHRRNVLLKKVRNSRERTLNITLKYYLNLVEKTSKIGPKWCPEGS